MIRQPCKLRAQEERVHHPGQVILELGEDVAVRVAAAQGVGAIPVDGDGGGDAVDFAVEGFGVDGFVEGVAEGADEVEGGAEAANEVEQIGVHAPLDGAGGGGDVAVREAFARHNLFHIGEVLGGFVVGAPRPVDVEGAGDAELLEGAEEVLVEPVVVRDGQFAELQVDGQVFQLGLVGDEDHADFADVLLDPSVMVFRHLVPAVIKIAVDSEAQSPNHVHVL